MKTMNTKKMLWASLSVTVALLVFACGKENPVPDKPVDPPVVPPTPTSVTIPYTVTVGSADESTTRATVDDDNKTLRFAAGDSLYITGTDIKGVLKLKSGAGEIQATFEGELTFTGSGSPASDLPLTATLVSKQQFNTSKITVNDAGAVTVNYPNNAYCATIKDAVKEYSNLTATSTFGAKSFQLAQQTAFLNFIITFEDGTVSGAEFTAVVKNGGSTVCSAKVATATESEKVVAKFVLPVAAGTELSSADVKMGKKDALSISNVASLTGKVYNVKRTQPIDPDAITGIFTVDDSGKKVYFSKGNLQASTTDKGAHWTWSFAETQWSRVGAATANTNITGNQVVSANGTVDLFGWSTSTLLGIRSSTLNNDYSGSFFEWGNASDVTKSIGTGWRTPTGTEWAYVFGVGTKKRTTTSGLLYCKAFVNDVPGVILLPDDWSTSFYALKKPNTANLSFSKGSGIDIITLADWENSFVPHGAVFLPTTGQREGASVTNDNGRLYYWSATSGSSTSGTGANANQMYIAGNEVNPDTGAGRHFGNAVRLVRTVQYEEQ